MKYRSFFLVLILLVVLPLYSFESPNPEKDDQEPFVVVLDAGHGGHDPGNLGNGYFEKNIALNIVLKIGAILEEDPNFKVIYTRKDDTFIDLYVRGEIANKANADLFVSVHCDSHTSNAHGAGTFVLGLHANKQNFEIAKKENSVIYLEDNYQDRYADYDINSPESVIGLTIMQEEFLDQSINLAKAIQDNFSNKLKRNDRKVKQAGFIVLHQTFMPSVLVETGFLTNDKEGAYLNSSKGQSEMGTAIANAIISYKGASQSGVTVVEQKEPTTTPEPEDELVNTPVQTPKEERIEPLDTKEIVAKKPAVTVSEVPVVSEPEVEEAIPEPVINDEPEKKEVVVKRIPSPEKDPVKPKVNIEYRVQLLASVKTIALTGSNFNGLNKLSKEPYKNLFRYMYGSAKSIKGAELLKANADLKGYPTSYIVAYKDGKRVSLKEASKYVSQ